MISLIEESAIAFREQKRLAESAMIQITDEQLRTALDPNTNSIAVIIKHMAGNMVSRWTDFLTTDGDKPDRNRDGEFIDTFASRDEMMAVWESGWARLFSTLKTLSDGDLFKHVTIRGEPLTVAGAINRQLTHYGYHVGQIILIARVLAKDQWQVITIPRGESETYNQRVRQRKT
ncbi:MAG: DUF1572 family protein [Burkholderiales bacterium]|nr:DUF1572 family protein [Phycisphaerae bacterium]